MLQDFSSFPPEQEREFVVYEQRLQATSKSAVTIAAIVSGVFALLVIAIVLTGEKAAPVIEAPEPEVEAPARPSRPAPAPTPAAAPEPEPAEAAAEAPAEPTRQPPPPPPGATKAPPTALTGGK